MGLRDVLRDKGIRRIARDSWAVSWPMALIMLYEFFIGLTDVYVAGKFGRAQQAAYGFAFQLYFIFIIIGIGLSIGVVSVVSRLFTSSSREELGAAVNSSVVTSAVLGLTLSVAGIVFSKNLINALSIPIQIKIYAAPFMAIYSLAFFFDYIMMTTNGILRASAMIKKSFRIMSVVCVMNIALDFFLAFKTPLGLKGIAAATVISLAIGAALSLYYTGRLAGKFSFSYSVLRKILDISWPSGLLIALWQLGTFTFFLILSLMPSHNIEIMAALTNGLKIESAIFLPAFAFNMANAVVIGNLLGKKEHVEAFRGGIVTAVMGVGIVAALTVIVVANAHRIAAFLSNDGMVIEASVRYIKIALIAEPLMAWSVILGGGLNGAGDTRSVMVFSAISVWLVRIPLSYILCIHFNFGAIAVWWTMNFSILVQAILVTVRYYGKKWIIRSERIVAM